MRKFVSKYVNACINFLYYKNASGRKPSLFNPIEKISIPFHTIHLDHYDPLMRSNLKNTLILTIVDAFTKFCILEPVRDTSTKYALGALGQLNTICAVPTQMISDRRTPITLHSFKASGEEASIFRNLVCIE